MDIPKIAEMLKAIGIQILAMALLLSGNIGGFPQYSFQYLERS